MTKILTGLLAVAIVAAVLAGAMAVTKRSAPSVFARPGMMPEVVSAAEMPRLLMPTVEVHAFCTVAMNASVYGAN